MPNACPYSRHHPTYATQAHDPQSLPRQVPALELVPVPCPFLHRPKGPRNLTHQGQNEPEGQFGCGGYRTEELLLSPERKNLDPTGRKDFQVQMV